MRAVGVALIGAAAFAAHAARVAARDRARVDGPRHRAHGGQHRRPGRRRRQAALEPSARGPAQPRVGHESGHDLERARVSRARLHVAHRGVLPRPFRRPQARRRSRAEGLRRSVSRRRGSLEAAADVTPHGAHGDHGRLGARRQLFRDRRAGARRVRWPALSHLQRRAERVADELQGRAIPVHGRSGAWPRQRRDRAHAHEPRNRQQPGARRRAMPRLPSRHLVQPCRARVARARGARRPVLAPLQRLWLGAHRAAARHVRVRPVLVVMEGGRRIVRGQAAQGADAAGGGGARHRR